MTKNLFKTFLLFTFVAPKVSAVYPCQCEIMKPGKKLRKAKAVFVDEVTEIGNNDKSEWATVAVSVYGVPHFRWRLPPSGGLRLQRENLKLPGKFKFSLF